MYEEAKGFYIKQLNVYVNSIEGSKYITMETFFYDLDYDSSDFKI